MSMPVIAVFVGVDTSVSPAFAIQTQAAILPGDKVMQVVALGGVPVGLDVTNSFGSYIPAQGYIVQQQSHNFSGMTFLALLSRG